MSENKKFQIEESLIPYLNNKLNHEFNFKIIDIEYPSHGKLI